MAMLNNQRVVYSVQVNVFTSRLGASPCGSRLLGLVYDSNISTMVTRIAFINSAMVQMDTDGPLIDDLPIKAFIFVGLRLGSAVPVKLWIYNAI